MQKKEQLLEQNLDFIPETSNLLEDIVIETHEKAPLESLSKNTTANLLQYLSLRDIGHFAQVNKAINQQVQKYTPYAKGLDMAKEKLALEKKNKRYQCLIPAGIGIPLSLLASSALSASIFFFLTWQDNDPACQALSEYWGTTPFSPLSKTLISIGMGAPIGTIFSFAAACVCTPKELYQEEMDQLEEDLDEVRQTWPRM